MKLTGRLKRLERCLQEDYPFCTCRVIRMFDHEPAAEELPTYPCPGCGRRERGSDGVAFIVMKGVKVEPNPPLP